MADQKNQEQENQKAGQSAYDKIGPQSIDGVEASDLPDKGRGSVETDYGKEAARNLPERTGEGAMDQSGLRAKPDLAQADARGGRKKN